jgi:hypothetical protein
VRNRGSQLPTAARVSTEQALMLLLDRMVGAAHDPQQNRKQQPACKRCQQPDQTRAAHDGFKQLARLAIDLGHTDDFTAATVSDWHVDFDESHRLVAQEDMLWLGVVVTCDADFDNDFPGQRLRQFRIEAELLPGKLLGARPDERPIARKNVCPQDFRTPAALKNSSKFVSFRFGCRPEALAAAFSRSAMLCRKAMVRLASCRRKCWVTKPDNRTEAAAHTTVIESRLSHENQRNMLKGFLTPVGDS